MVAGEPTPYRGEGVELSQNGVNRSIAHAGLSVIQGDADADLQYYPDQAYDYAVLGQTLQTLRNPKDVIEQLVRIARHAIVSVAEFCRIGKIRMYLAFGGRMPVTKTLSLPMVRYAQHSFLHHHGFRGTCAKSWD